MSKGLYFTLEEMTKAGTKIVREKYDVIIQTKEDDYLVPSKQNFHALLSLLSLWFLSVTALAHY